MHCLPHLICTALPSLPKHLPDSFHLDSWYFVLNHKTFVWEQFTEAWNKVVSNGTSSEEHCCLTALRITRVWALLWPSKLLGQPAVINPSRRLSPEYFGMGVWQTYLSSEMFNSTAMTWTQILEGLLGTKIISFPLCRWVEKAEGKSGRLVFEVVHCQGLWYCCTAVNSQFGD